MEYSCYNVIDKFKFMIIILYHNNQIENLQKSLRALTTLYKIFILSMERVRREYVTQSRFTVL